MLRRVLITLLLAAVVLVGALAPGAWRLYRNQEWALDRAHEMAARQLADTLRREVSLGPIRGNVLHGVTIVGLAVAARQRLADGALFSIPRLTVRYDLPEAFRAGRVNASMIREIHLYHPQALLTQDQHGHLNIDGLLPKQGPKPPEKHFRGKIYVHDGFITLRSAAPMWRGGPVRVSLRRVEAVADLAATPLVTLTLRGEVAGPQARHVRLQATVGTENHLVAARVTVEDLDLPWVYHAIGERPWLHLAAGRGDVNAHLFLIPGSRQRDVDFGATVRTADLSLVAPRLGTAPVHASGAAWIGSSGIVLHDMKARWAGADFAVSGSVGSLHAPVLDLSVRSDRVPAAAVLALVPAPRRQGWSLPQAGSIAAAATIVGPPSDPDVHVEGRVTGPLRVRMARWGDALLNRATFRASVISPRNPVLTADLNLAELRTSRVSLSRCWPRRRAPLQTARLERLPALTARLSYCDRVPTLSATLQGARGELDDHELSQGAAQLAYDGRVLEFKDVRARVLGATLHAHGRARVAGRTQAALEGTLTGLDLARLAELPLGLHEPLAGNANVRFRTRLDSAGLAATGQFWASDVRARGGQAGYCEGAAGVTYGQSLAGASRVQVRDAGYDDLTGLAGEGLVELRDRQLQVTGGYLAGAPGVVWAEGNYDLATHTVNGQVRAAEVDLAPVGKLLQQPDLGGTGYLGARLGGTFQDPTAEANVVLFHPHYRDYELGALTAHATYRGDELNVDNFHADYRKAVMSGQGTVTGLRAKRKDAGLDGSVQVEAFNLERLGDVFKRDLPTAGLAEASLLVSGTVAEPRAKGLVRLAHARYDEWLVDRAEIPLVADRKRVTVGNGTAEAYGGRLQFKGEAQLTDPVTVDARLSGSGLHIAGLAPLWEVGLPVLGEVSLADTWLQGPWDKLRGGGRLTCPAARLAAETVENVKAQWALDAGKLAVSELTCSAAGGTVDAHGTYAYQSPQHEVEAAVGLSGTEVQGLLALAAPLAGLSKPAAGAEGPSLEQRLRSLALRLKGHTRARAQVTGPLKTPRLVCDVATDDLALDGRALPEITAHAARQGQQYRDLNVALKQGQALVTVDGSLDLDGEVDCTVQGSACDLALLRPWVRVGVPVGGRVGFTVAASGRTRKPDLQASVDVENPSLAGVRFDMLNLPLATLTDGKLAVDTLVLKRGKQQIALDGELPFSYEVPQPEADGKPTTAWGLLPDGPVRFRASIGQTDLAFFPPLIEEFVRAQKKSPAHAATAWSALGASGTVDSAVDITGTARNPQVRGFLKLADGVLLPPGWQEALKPLVADLVFSGHGAENLVEVRQLGVGFAGARADLTGTVKAARDGLHAPEHNSYDLRLGLQAQSTAVPGGAKLSDVKGGVTLNTTAAGRHVLKALPLTGVLGGGKLSLSGQAVLTSFAPAELARNDFDLRLGADHCRLRLRQLADVMLDGYLALQTPPGANAVLKGRLGLSNGVFMAGGGSAKGPRRELLAFSSRQPSPEFDVKVALGTGLAVRGSGVTAPLEPNPEAVVLTGTAQRPELTGNVTARRGNVSLPTGRLTIEEFKAQFGLAPPRGMRSDPLPLEFTGIVNGRATTTLSLSTTSGTQAAEAITVNLDISGNLPDDVHLEATSNSTLTESQLFALLGGLPTASLPGSAASDQGFTSLLSERFMSTLATAFKSRLFDPFEEELKRRLGLAELGVNFTLDQPVSVKVGKYLLENLLVTYERSVANGPEAYNLEVAYQLANGPRIIYHRDDQGDSRLRVGYTFGF